MSTGTCIHTYNVLLGKSFRKKGKVIVRFGVDRVRYLPSDVPTHCSVQYHDVMYYNARGHKRTHTRARNPYLYSLRQQKGGDVIYSRKADTGGSAALSSSIRLAFPSPPTIFRLWSTLSPKSRPHDSSNSATLPHCPVFHESGP